MLHRLEAYEEEGDDDNGDTVNGHDDDISDETYVLQRIEACYGDKIRAMMITQLQFDSILIQKCNSS